MAVLKSPLVGGNKMLRSKFYVVFLAAFLMLVAAFLPGSIPEGSSGQSVPVYGDLTEKEDCVTNLVLAFRDRDIARFQELLHEDYVFHYADQVMSLIEDISKTTIMFERVVLLGLVIGPGEWKATTSAFGKECADCWESERGYVLVANVPGDNSRVMMSRGKYNIVLKRITEGDNQLYKILALEDIKTGLKPIFASAPE